MKIARGGAARRRQPRTRPGTILIAGARTLRVLKHRHRGVRLCRTPVARGKAVTRAYCACPLFSSVRLFFLSVFLDRAQAACWVGTSGTAPDPKLKQSGSPYPVAWTAIIRGSPPDTRRRTLAPVRRRSTGFFLNVWRLPPPLTLASLPEHEKIGMVLTGVHLAHGAACRHFIG